jgi:hypothetical protein
MRTTTICRLDVDHLFVEAREQDIMSPCPPGWVFADPPQPQKAMVAKWIAGQWMMMPADEAQAHRTAAVAAAILAVLRAQALAALRASDDSIWQFIEQGKPVPTKWRAYRSALRKIATDGEATVLPDAP